MPSRTVRLPLCREDPAVAEAVARYGAEVRDDSPWCPGNVDFIRRINGLDSVANVVRIVFAAQYQVVRWATAISGPRLPPRSTHGTG